MDTATFDPTRTWWSQESHGDEMLVAYFSMEFGISAQLPIYSGGLGILAGDHLKAAADLGLPLVGVGLFYRGGYFTQGINDEGRQTERYQELDPAELGLVREDVTVEVDLAGETVAASVWRHDVGSVPLYLLDVPWVTDALYSGDRLHRIRQELLLGVGGIRALRALGLDPTVYHVNEGHSAFLTIERLRELVATGVPRDEALDLIRETTVFTTHTPVPAGNEVFDPNLVTKYVGELAQHAGLSHDELLGLGHSEEGGGFGLTPLALRLSRYANGVSELHGEVARKMWSSLGPSAAIEHVTNGVHLGTWLAPELEHLLVDSGVQPSAPPAWGNWEAVERIDGGALWNVHHSLKRRLTERTDLDPELLTFGFARRFATYKRAGLAFSDLPRLLQLPVQIVVAGKAHPQDQPGKDVMQQIVQLSHASGAGRIVFLEDYDMELAAEIIPSVDVWLNTPRRPYEASGTSGMKAAVNGVLNFSVLDGWWAEAYDPAFGWAIEGLSDDEDAGQLYSVLEHDLLPAWNDRGRWVEMMKASIGRLSPVFSMQRAVIEYTDRYYRPASRAAG